MRKTDIGNAILTSALGSTLVLGTLFPVAGVLASEGERGQGGAAAEQGQAGEPEQQDGADASSADGAGDAQGAGPADSASGDGDVGAGASEGSDGAGGAEGPEGSSEAEGAGAQDAGEAGEAPGTDGAADTDASDTDGAPGTDTGADTDASGTGAADALSDAEAPAADAAAAAAPAAPDAAEALSLVLVDKAEVAPGESVGAVFLVSQDYLAGRSLAAAALELAAPDGTPLALDASALSASGALFRIDTSQTGEGQVSFARVALVFSDGTQADVPLAGLGYGFTVSSSAQASQLGEDGGASLSFYTADSEGNLVEAADMEDALAQAEAASGSASALASLPSFFSGALSASPLSSGQAVLAYSASSTIVVALDAGHSSTYPGAQGVNGLAEEELTLKIAQYCKAELETYPGVEVYMVRSGAESPYPDASSEAEELKERVRGAVAAGASVYVSIHLNAFDGVAYGAEVWYPNTYLNAYVADLGQELSADILEQLADLGLDIRGTKQNGSLSDGRDYYSVIRTSKENGIPGIIVEHAFITSEKDAQILSTEEGLRSLGVADAEGIASYFGLTKDGPAENARVVTTGVVTFSDADVRTGTMRVTASNVSCSEGVSSVSVSLANGAADASGPKRYTLAEQADGTWAADVPLADLGVGSAGEVSLEARGYVVCPDGETRLFSSATMSVEVAGPSGEAGELKLSAAWDASSHALSLSASGGVVPAAGNVAFQVTGASGATLWVQAERASDGSWSASARRADVGEGEATVRLWATVGGQTSSYGQVAARVPAAGQVTAKVSVGPYDASSGTFRVSVTDVASEDGVGNVAAGVYPTSQGAGAARWYLLSDVGGGTWAADVPLADFGGLEGSYSADAALNDASWSNHSLGTASGEVSVGEAEVEASFDEGSGAMEVRVSGGVIPLAGNVAFQVTGASGATLWYQAVRASDGSWSAEVPYADHGAGSAAFAAWAATSDGTSQVAEATASFPLPAAPQEGAVTVALSDGSEAFVLTARGGSFPEAANVAFRVYDEEAPSVRWLQAERLSNGTWTCTVSVASLSGGSVEVEGWATVATSQGTDTLPLGDAEFTSTLHPIMGEGSGVTAAQLAAAYRRSGAAYPADVYKDKGAPTVEDFCRIVVEEAQAEGVDPAVVFAQAMYETGYLRFGGDVKAEQCNFCGLGATGNNEGGATFQSVAEGVRAQVQHLKAYASTEALNGERVDPRFDYVRRGVAPYVESLGGRWAVSSSYGFALAGLIDALV